MEERSRSGGAGDARRAWVCAGELLRVVSFFGLKIGKPDGTRGRVKKQLRCMTEIRRSAQNRRKK
jgi:hypothetical protein